MLEIAKRFAIHLLILLVVVILPPLIYGAVNESNLRDIPGLSILGGLTYPAYAVYWVTRLHSPRAKFILFHLISLVSIAVFVLEGIDRSMALVLVGLPASIGAIAIPGAAIAAFRQKRHLALTCIFSSLVSLPLGLGLSLFALYSVGMSSAMSGMRW